MAVFYIDISSFQAGINLAGWHAVCSKITQGTGYTNPYWQRFKGQAANAGRVLLRLPLPDGRATALARLITTSARPGSCPA